MFLRRIKNKRKERELVTHRNYGSVAWAIFRGGIERLVKNKILHALEFSDLDQCIDCIKGKYVKQIKKGATVAQEHEKSFTLTFVEHFG